MFKKLEEIIKEIKGNILILELDNELIEKFDKNNKVNLFSISSNTNSKSKTVNSKKKVTNKGKNINIKKLRKYINKKSTDVIICNMNLMFKYYKYFIKDSIYISNNLIYLYADNDIDKEFLIKKYKRYNVKIQILDYKNSYILKIDNTKGKNNFFKDKIYFIKDTFYNMAEFIGNILIS